MWFVQSINTAFAIFYWTDKICNQKKSFVLTMNIFKIINLQIIIHEQT